MDEIDYTKEVINILSGPITCTTENIIEGIYNAKQLNEPTKIIINPEDFNNFFKFKDLRESASVSKEGWSIYGLKIIVTRDCKKNTVYII